LDWFDNQLRGLSQEKTSLALGLIQSRILMIAERDKDAIEILQPLLQEHDRNLWLHYYLAICYDKLKQFENTEKHLKICIELDPENAELLNFLGYFYADKNVNLTEAEI
jgi:tetratricopeptide (TPR) repeat protein